MEPMNLLKMQVQNRMLIELYKNTGSSRSVGAPSSTGSTSFETLLKNCLDDSAVGSETYQQSDISSLLESLGVNSRFSTGETSDNGGTQVSNKLVQFVAVHEGYYSTPYRGADSQNLTIGYGHVIEPNENYTNLTKSQALELLKKDLSGSVDSVNKEFGGQNLTQNQFDSLVSFAFNLGNNIWSTSPKLTGDIKAGASAETLKADFASFDNCNGKELSGLYNRRIDEWGMFVSGSYNLNI